MDMFALFNFMASIINCSMTGDDEMELNIGYGVADLSYKLN